MSDPIVFGFPYSTFVHIVRLILTHKGAAYTFRDLETEMGKPTHLALHPFNRVPILQHDDFTVYETSAIVTYIDETFEKPPLQPKKCPRPRAHAPMDQRDQFLLLHIHDLSRDARAPGVSTTGHRVRREGRGACASESRAGPPGIGAPAGPREENTC